MRTLSVVFLLLFFLAMPTRAQNALRLTAPDGRVDDQFTRVSALRELPDGRLLIADSREKRLMIANAASLRTRQVGRIGDGPGEYRAPSRLLPGAGESTYVIDTQARRWMLLVGDRFTPSIPPEMSLRLTSYEPPIRGLDGRGRLLITTAFRLYQRTFDSDSTLLEVAYLHLTERDTIARLKGRGSARGSVTRRDGGLTVEYLLYNPFGVEEQAYLFPDGWIAIAYLAPYRVRWIRPDGSEVEGPVLASSATAASQEEKRFAVAREWSWLPKPLLAPSDFPAWPTSVPSFQNDALLPLHDGRISVWKMPTVNSPENVYEIIDRRGEVSARLTLPPAQRVLAFGARHVYVVSRDEDGVETVDRHRWPF